MENNLKVKRAEMNLTQDDLAKKVRVTRQTIIAIESGRYDPSLELAFKFAHFFNITIEEIFTYK
jgi:putative transcriptional regulator